MRKQFVRTVEDLMAKDERLVLLLGDIGVFGFRNAFQRFPTRTYNIGVCEQAMTGLAAGLSNTGWSGCLVLKACPSPATSALPFSWRGSRSVWAEYSMAAYS